MIRFKWIPLLLAALMTACSVGWCQPQSSAGTREITMTARKYEFDPGAITVKQGERVKLVITAIDRDHGFELKAFNINQHLKKGVPTTVEFTAARAGTFPFKCSDFCGLGHSHMKGKLVVEAASASSR